MNVIDIISLIDYISGIDSIIANILNLFVANGDCLAIIVVEYDR